MWEYRCRVVDVHDGDTVKVEVDLGFQVGILATWVRLLGTFAPELSQIPGGEETRQFVWDWVDAGEATAPVKDWPFTLKTTRVKDDSHEIVTFGRYVGELFRSDGRELNTDVTDYVAKNGFPHGIGG